MKDPYKSNIDKGGRPPIYNDPDKLLEKCAEYFDTHTKYTITGLCLFLGFCARSTLDDYSKKDKFSYIVKRAKLVVEMGYEEMFHNGSNAGIFPLKNMGWSDKVETENTHTIKKTVVKWGENEIEV